MNKNRPVCAYYALRKGGAVLVYAAPAKNRFLRGMYLMVQRYLRHDVGIHSAALAFYLLFYHLSVFQFSSAPCWVLLHLDVAEILQALQEILPAQIVDFA